MVEHTSKLKTNLVNNLQHQIDEIINYYEVIIDELKSEKSKLESEVEEYKSKLLETEKKFEETVLLNEQKTKNQDYKLKQPILTFKQKMDYALQLITLKLYGECGLYLEKFLKEILIDKHFDTEEIRTYFRNNADKTNSRFLSTDHPEIIVPLAMFYFLSNQHDYLRKLIKLIIENSKRLDNKFEIGQFFRLLWYNFYLGEQKSLVTIFNHSKNYLDLPIAEAEIYNLYKKIIQKRVDINTGLNQINLLKEKCKILNQNEKLKLFTSLDKRLKKLMIDSKQNQPLIQKVDNNPGNVRKISFVIKLPTEMLTLPDSNNVLSEEWIKLAVFKDVYLKEYEGYTLVKAFSYKNQGNVFVTVNGIKEIRKKIGRRWFDVRSYQDENKVERNLRENEIKNNHCAWPSTENKGRSQENDKNQLNEESELKKLGYQITGLTREKRWTILETAVKNLGLKKVAFTIAKNVKLRKGQKNGEKKFSYAIGEWEYDLAKLKQQYYKNNFTWPSTKMNMKN